MRGSSPWAAPRWLFSYRTTPQASRAPASPVADGGREPGTSLPLGRDLSTVPEAIALF
jgi:hypothetical protein